LDQFFYGRRQWTAIVQRAAQLDVVGLASWDGQQDGESAANLEQGRLRFAEGRLGAGAAEGGFDGF
jgi:hypothetical protein